MTSSKAPPPDIQRKPRPAAVGAFSLRSRGHAQPINLGIAESEASEDTQPDG